MTSQTSGAEELSDIHKALADKTTERPYYHSNIDRRLVPEGVAGKIQPYTTRTAVGAHSSYSKAPPAFLDSKANSGLICCQRDKAWQIVPWPCIGLGSWLTPQLSRMPVYPEVLKRVKEGQTLADVGTFLGHDLRRLVYDGAPSDNLYGVDIINHFDLGYEFFRDRDHFRGHYIESDILSDMSPDLTAFKGAIDVIVISQVLHQWGWESQLRAAQNLCTLTKPGSIVVGIQVGNTKAQDAFLKDLPKSTWRHDPESFAKMWDLAGEATGSRWETQSVLRNFEEMGWLKNDSAWLEPGACIIEFVARRVS